MPEAVIVDSVRTPIGRAFKGSLKDLRPDETAAFVLDALLERNPDVDPQAGRGRLHGVRPAAGPAGQQHRPHRRAALQAACARRPTASTVSRYCASSLETIRLAANNVIAGQGDVYIAGGVEFVSRFNEAQEAAHPEDQNEQAPGQGAASPTRTSRWA